ncbi:zinc finger SWIM domain-containing protein 7 [Cynoglossus semilaevis]|uniref:zinc finger SWIM domain-containing protein 7 n=1 Tax=Cynoglossus semilaevis TaxID=244447 RepID=UPI000497D796|nr:zinc finger SWIM domain-containing protein 7 [Cynoglossus semilaevis]
MRSFIHTVAEQLLQDIQKTYRATSHIPDDLLLALKFVFGPCVLQALNLVDQRSVTCVSSPSGCQVFQVVSASGRLYTCIISCHYCPCPAFAHTVLRKNEGLLCKHILAVYLSEAMAVTQQESVTDQQMTMLLRRTSTP